MKPLFLIAALALAGCADMHWQPIPGADPPMPAMAASLDCFGAVARAGATIPVFPAPAAILLTPYGQAHLAVTREAKVRCMAEHGYAAR